MGYSHHYRITTTSSEWRNSWPNFVKDVKLIIEASSVGITDPRGFDENGGNYRNDNDPDRITIPIPPPIVDQTRGIGINGIGDGAHEPLLIDCQGHLPRASVTTGRKPYDEVVTCVLVRAFMVAPHSCSITSDGDWDDWVDGRTLYTQIWGEMPLCPWGGVFPTPPQKVSPACRCCIM
ncbi:hypothetical protein ASPWEDRAFT_170016 [Aspergillus wentii DTO 134E9]|uniref:Uncharacterized protein n=1 Tax=Aspergillus wentii DTO 134E9 TaxID=1073089 RepID=A0A1L9RNJ6_ASPWE|nr:uncharacterized protein ASPWEDRAFT_170016 [Aspergillus wentii DTO 134E9]KAI9934356.1 hypothetical protein MW887_005433 [Aspergillus wentii]OJJ36501.1 hypothetical protein ASPWEDRAFT_170016 [Aspergillus wentii DTO 134E9]